MPNMNGTGPFGNGRTGRGMGPCRTRNDVSSRPVQDNEQQADGLGPRFRNTRRPGLSGMRNRFGGRNRGYGRSR